MSERNPQTVEKAQTEVICDIGQVTKVEAAALDRAVRRGEIAKWKGYWYPTSGANFGIGPLKTCWGPRAALSHPFVSHHSPLNQA